MNCCWISMFGVGGRERVLRVSYSAILLMPLRQLTYWIRIDLFDSPLSFNHLAPKTYFTCCVCVCHSVISDSLQPYELETARLLYPWNSPGKRILECVAIPFCWGSFQPRDQIQVSCIAGRRFNLWATSEAQLWCWKRLLRIPWTARRSNQSILKEISPEYSLERLMLKLKLQYFGHLMQRADSFEKSWFWERLKVGGEGDNRGRDSWMASQTQRT